MKVIRLNIIALIVAIVITPFLEARKNCRPVSITNGTIRRRSKGLILSYKCNRGYMMLGEPFSACFRGKWDPDPPVCIKPGCIPIRNFKNGQVAESMRSALLEFSCKPGYKLVGPSFIYCNGQSWNVMQPYCKATDISCNFEDESTCSWLVETHDEDDFMWHVQQHELPSRILGTGPRSDHTFPSDESGRYLVIETRDYASKESMKPARLHSPKFPLPSNNNTCFIFWYHMFGATIGMLNVFLNNKVVFQEKGNHGDRWIKGVVPLHTNGTDLQIIIEGTHGGGETGDIALDDFSIGVGPDCTYSKVGSCEEMCGKSGSDTATCLCTPECFVDSSCCDDYDEFCGSDTSTRELDTYETESTERSESEVSLMSTLPPESISSVSSNTLPNSRTSNTNFDRETSLTNSTESVSMSSELSSSSQSVNEDDAFQNTTITFTESTKEESTPISIENALVGIKNYTSFLPSLTSKVTRIITQKSSDTFITLRSEASEQEYTKRTTLIPATTPTINNKHTLRSSSLQPHKSETRTATTYSPTPKTDLSTKYSITLPKVTDAITQSTFPLFPNTAKLSQSYLTAKLTKLGTTKMVFPSSKISLHPTSELPFLNTKGKVKHTINDTISTANQSQRVNYTTTPLEYATQTSTVQLTPIRMKIHTSSPSKPKTTSVKIVSPTNKQPATALDMSKTTFHYLKSSQITTKSSSVKPRATSIKIGSNTNISTTLFELSKTTIFKYMTPKIQKSNYTSRKNYTVQPVLSSTTAKSNVRINKTPKIQKSTYPSRKNYTVQPELSSTTGKSNVHINSKLEVKLHPDDRPKGEKYELGAQEKHNDNRTVKEIIIPGVCGVILLVGGIITAFFIIRRRRLRFVNDSEGDVLYASSEEMLDLHLARPNQF